MLDDEQVISMRRCSRLPVVVSIRSKHSTCMKIAKSLLKGTLMALSSIPFVFGEAHTVIPDIQGNCLAESHHQEGLYVSRCGHDFVHVGNGTK